MPDMTAAGMHAKLGKHMRPQTVLTNVNRCVQCAEERRLHLDSKLPEGFKLQVLQANKAQQKRAVLFGLVTHL